MFITTRKHLAIIQEIRHYWSNELDRMRRENLRLKAQLEAKTSSETVPEPPLPAPLPAFFRATAVIIHLPSDDPRKTLCKENVRTMNKPGSPVRHIVSSTSRRTMLPGESWCADCLG